MGSRRSRASVLCGQSSHECDDWGTLLPCDFLSIRSYHIGSLLDLPSCHAHHAPAAPSVPHRVRSRRTACELHARGRRAAPDPKRDQPADPAARGIPRPLAVRARASFAAADDRWRAIRSAGAPSPHAMRGSHARCDEALRRSRTDDRVLVRCGVAVAHATPARVSRQLSGHQAAADRARRPRRCRRRSSTWASTTCASRRPPNTPRAACSTRKCFPSARQVLAGRTLAAADLANETLLRLEDGQRQWMSWSEWFDQNDIDRQKARPQDITINSYPQIVQMTILGQACRSAGAT